MAPIWRRHGRHPLGSRHERLKTLLPFIELSKETEKYRVMPFLEVEIERNTNCFKKQYPELTHIGLDQNLHHSLLKKKRNIKSL